MWPGLCSKGSRNRLKMEASLFPRAAIAQTDELPLRKAQVAGSTHAGGSNLNLTAQRLWYDLEPCPRIFWAVSLKVN